MRKELQGVVRRREVYEEVQEEVQKCEAHVDDEVCDLPKPKRVCSSFVGRVGW